MVEQEFTHEVRNPLYDEERGFLLFHNARQVRSFPGVQWPEMTNNELAHLFKLSRTLNANNRIRPATAKQVAEVIGLSLRRTYDFLFMMQGLRIIAKTEHGFYMNPIYFFAGKYLKPELYRLFKEELHPHLSAWARERMEGAESNR